MLRSYLGSLMQQAVLCLLVKGREIGRMASTYFLLFARVWALNSERNHSFLFLTSDGWKTDCFGCFYNFLLFSKPRRLELITTLPLDITRFESICQLLFGSGWLTQPLVSLMIWFGYVAVTINFLPNSHSRPSSFLKGPHFCSGRGSYTLLGKLIPSQPEVGGSSFL